MNEHDFLLKLQQRAKEQEKLVHEIPFPNMFKRVSLWFGNHPWRILIPLALIFTLIFHIAIGKPYDDFILRIFGGPG